MKTENNNFNDNYNYNQKSISPTPTLKNSQLNNRNTIHQTPKNSMNLDKSEKLDKS